MTLRLLRVLKLCPHRTSSLPRASQRVHCQLPVCRRVVGCPCRSPSRQYWGGERGGEQLLCRASSSSTGYTSLEGSEGSAGSFPRFFHPHPLPSEMGMQACLQDAESAHALKSLRLKEGDTLELCDTEGWLQLAKVVGVRKKSQLLLEATEAPRYVERNGTEWVVAVACGSLKGGRADWLVEKACELGASALQPLLTVRSDSMGGRNPKGSSPKSGDAGGPAGREGRLQRVALAATKQSLRAHGMPVLPPVSISDYLPEVRAATVALIAVGGAPPVKQVLEDASRALTSCGAKGVILIGPEGDWTTEERRELEAAGALAVGLGDLRLRTETAALALLSAARLCGP